MPITLLLHWSNLGPFHLARLNAASRDLKPYGVKIVGLEMTSQYEMYPWEVERHSASFERYVAIPGKTFEQATALELWQGMWKILDQVNPDAVGINGYSLADTWSAIVWCKLHRRAAIILSDSKHDDFPRNALREWVKSLIVRQFDSGLCAGIFSKEYLEELGLASAKIFYGCDAVDNDYFWREAERVRQNPDAYRSLPGLESPEPFFLATSRFVKLKNLDGLLRAYGDYRRQFLEAGLQPWRLVLVGDGDERSALEHQILAENIDGVSFPGFKQIDELPIYYGLASAFVHPSFQDTWGLVVNEAMSAGLPVIVSKGAGCWVDLVDEGKNGFSFSPKDLTTLTNLLVKMSSDQVDLQAMGRASLDRIREWGPHRFSQGLYSALQIAMKTWSPEEPENQMRAAAQ